MADKKIELGQMIRYLSLGFCPPFFCQTVVGMLNFVRNLETLIPLSDESREFLLSDHPSIR